VNNIESIHEGRIVCSPNAFLCHPLGANDELAAC
jgi:hypothetical protein